MAGLLSRMDSTEIEWRLFSNEIVLAELRKNPDYVEKLITPTEDESAFISSSLSEWTDDEIGRRTLLVQGEGELSEFYRKTLERIRGEYQFDLILLWSENGAVRRFAAALDLPVLHLELGPTRSPFPETLYIDCRGTNGSASFLSIDLDTYPSEKVLPAATWLGLSAAAEEEKPSVLELQATSPVLPWETGQPYVVVALQLADDLNTICHSEFTTPKEFLQFLLPRLIGLGFKVIVKGHPGAPVRPINLVYEIEALNYAREYGDDVAVLERTLPATQFIPILSGAVAVCSINSSVSFEALLLGVPGLVYGTAVYDIGYHLKKASQEFLDTGKWTLDPERVNRLVTVLCRHILLPKNSESLSRSVQGLIQGTTAGLTPAEYANLLIGSASQGYSTIDEEIGKTDTKLKLITLTKEVGILDSTYMGHVDQIKGESLPTGYRLLIQGWVARRGNGHSPIRLVAVSDAKGEILGYTDLFDRPDVRKVHPSINYPVGFGATALLSSAEIRGTRLLFITEGEVVTWNLEEGGIAPSSVLRLPKKGGVGNASPTAEPYPIAPPRSLMSEINKVLRKLNASCMKRG